MQITKFSCPALILGVSSLGHTLREEKTRKGNAESNLPSSKIETFAAPVRHPPSREQKTSAIRDFIFSHPSRGQA